MRQKYFRLKDMNEHMLKQLENGQQELDVLNSKVEGLQEVMYIDPLCANRNKRRLLFASAEMLNKPLWQTVWTQIRLLL